MLRYKKKAAIELLNEATKASVLDVTYFITSDVFLNGKKLKLYSYGTIKRPMVPTILPLTMISASKIARRKTGRQALSFVEFL